MTFWWTLASLAARAQSSETVDRAVEVAQQRLGDQLQGDALYAAALQGVADKLNQTLGVEGNRILTRAQLAQQQAFQQGDREGIGVEFSLVAGQGLMLTDVFVGGPAARAGLVPGELIVGLSGHALTGLSRNQMHALVQTKRMDDVVLDVRRRDGSLRQVRVQRGPYQVAPVRRVNEQDPPQIRIQMLAPGGASLLRGLVRTIPPHALVLDLRDSAGGQLDEAVAAADLFLPEGTVILERHPLHGSVERRLAKESVAWAGDLVVLVNRGTSGPAEALAAALQAHNRATLVGTPTAGVHHDTIVVPLTDDLVLQLVDATLRRPDGSSWSGGGLRPDLYVESVEVTVPRAVTQSPLDLQREAAIQLIRTD